MRQWRSEFVALATEKRRLASGLRLAQNLMINSAAGRNLVLFLLVLAFIAGLCLARAGPDGQPSYYYGVIGLQFLICGYGIYSMASQQRLQVLAGALVLVYAGMGGLRYGRQSFESRSGGVFAAESQSIQQH